jgi:hypothetical protein
MLTCSSATHIVEIPRTRAIIEATGKSMLWRTCPSVEVEGAFAAEEEIVEGNMLSVIVDVAVLVGLGEESRRIEVGALYIFARSFNHQ